MKLIAYIIAFSFVIAAMLALPAHANRFDDFQRLKGEGKLEEALKVLREEFADPSFALRRAANRVTLRAHFLIGLGEHAAIVGVSPALDAEAKTVYEDAMKFADNDAELQLAATNGMGLYYSKSLRNGLALLYFRRELAHWQRTNNRFRLVLTYDAMAAAYWDMGEHELSQFYLTKLLDAASGYFVVGQRPSDINEWVQYWTILGSRMDSASQLENHALLDKLWALREPIEPRYFIGNGATTGFVAAQAFAFAGLAERAHTILARAKELWPKSKLYDMNPRQRKLGDAALVCAEGMVAVALKNYDGTAARLEECEKQTNEAGLKENQANIKQKIGMAYEGVGNLERASAAYRASVSATEAMRSSYTVAERAKFFRTSFRLSYWGLVRLQAKQAANDGTAFFEAMHTSELVRGRQLGELLDPEMSQRISPASLKALRERLPEDAAVLAYTVTDTEIVLLAMTRERLLASVTPYDAKSFANLMRTISRNLSEPNSNPVQLDARLLQASKTVLAAARPLLAGKKRIIALPDGVMNTVPFELFSAADDSYRPLIADFTVSASPSLLFIQHAERQQQSGSAANLIAFADPNYVKPKALIGASLQDVQEATRGSRYLSYFEPLPETRTEATSIAKMFDGQKVELFFGDKATESQVKRLDLTQYAFLHFATHGILGGEVPGVGEPALVLSDEPNEDGFLTSSEVGKLKIHADLTVLSACNTGSGEFVSGEGVMGISRAFLAAGSRSVVVSLWPVASMQTERLMVDFYRQLRSGLPAADALRAAKLGMAAQARKVGAPETHPFFWGAFILLGG